MSTPESSGENVKKEELSLNEAPDAATGSVDSAQEAPNKLMKPKRFLRLAVAGCSHGEMDKIYETLTQWEIQSGKKYDLLICTGDFQAIRNYGDLHYMKCPDKFKHLMTFYKYYSGEQVAPVLTIFIGGNHESSGFMAELPYGGWVAPNIYYMGYSSVIRFAGLRIAGLSGIYDTKDFHRDSFTPNPVDIMVTHDWPAGITDYGDVHGLLQIKPYFEESIQNNKLGNPVAMDLLNDIRPKYWFSSHMHCFFRAEVPHDAPNSSLPTPEPTKFLALDKPLPRHRFLETINIPIEENAQMQLEYDPIWLAIMKNTDRFTEVTERIVHLPSPASASRNERWDFRPTDEEIAEVDELFKNNFKIPKNFRQTAPPHQPTDTKSCPPSLYYRNPQTMEFCQKLKIKDFNLLLCQVPGKTNFIGEPQYMIEQLATNPNDIHLDDEDENKKLVNPSDLPTDSEISADPKKLRSAVVTSIDEIVGEIEDCRENLANQAGHHILTTDTVITYKFSSSPTLKEFFKQIRCCILSVDDNPTDPNITANVIESVEILGRMRSATRVVLSAAAILPDGSCITPAGTLAICLAAKRHSVPVLICAAFYKLTPMFVPNLDAVNSHGSPTDILPFSDALKYPSVFISNPLFDLIPAQLVSLYVTHTSAISPAHIYRLIADYYHPDDFYNVD